MKEKEEIERLKLCSNNECNICGRYEKEECMLERNRCEKTVLKALEQKDKEISELKEDNQHQWDERCKLTFAYDKDTHTLQNQLDVANADRVEKDKIIDEMAGEIAALNYEFIGDWCKQDECEKFKRNENHSRECDTNNHNCIKQYFEKKVRNKYE